MNIMTCLPWFALYVKPRHEKKLTTILHGKGYETFCPTYKHRVKYHKSFEVPLFPGYVFCRLDLANRFPVISTPGIFSIVGKGAEPESICEEELAGIKRIVDANMMPRPWPYVVPGQEVAVESGPLRGVRGVVVDSSDEKWLVVSIDLLQRSIAVKMEREFLALEVVSRRPDQGADLGKFFRTSPA